MQKEKEAAKTTATPSGIRHFIAAWLQAATLQQPPNRTGHLAGLFAAGDLDVAEAEGGHAGAGFFAEVGADGVDGGGQVEHVAGDHGAFDGVGEFAALDAEAEIDAGGEVAGGGVGRELGDGEVKAVAGVADDFFGGALAEGDLEVGGADAAGTGTVAGVGLVGLGGGVGIVKLSGEEAALEDGDAATAGAFAVEGAAVEAARDEGVVGDGEERRGDFCADFAAEIGAAALEAFGVGGGGEVGEEIVGGQGAEDDGHAAGGDASCAQHAAGAFDGGAGERFGVAIVFHAAGVEIVIEAFVVAGGDEGFDFAFEHGSLPPEAEAGGGDEEGSAGGEADLAAEVDGLFEFAGEAEVGGGDGDDVVNGHGVDGGVEEAVDFGGRVGVVEVVKIGVGGAFAGHAGGAAGGGQDAVFVESAAGGVTHGPVDEDADGGGLAAAGVGFLDGGFFKGDADVVSVADGNVGPLSAEVESGAEGAVG